MHEIRSQTDKSFCNLDQFLNFYLPNDPENQDFKKIEKTPGDIIILQMCTINDNHMMYGSCEMEFHKQSFLSFRTIFCPFTFFYPLRTQQIKILEKWK